MDPLSAVTILLQLINAGNSLLQTASQVGGFIQKAQAEGRDLTPEEMAQVRALDDAARVRLTEAIRAAGG